LGNEKAYSGKIQTTYHFLERCYLWDKSLVNLSVKLGIQNAAHKFIFGSG